jgi:hypothetical protein
LWREIQKSLFQEEVNEATFQYVGGVWASLKARISVKIVSGVECSAIPDTIKMSEAAGQKLWGFNRATSFFRAANPCYSLIKE